MRAEIISVGTELLLGDILNTNARFLSQELAALGFSVYNQTVVGDNAARLASVVTAAKDRSDVIVLSGGLGPTADDLTKETVAEVFGDSLDMDPEVLDTIEGYFRAAGKAMTDNNRKQALRPRRGGLFANPNGTAPGVYFRQGGKYAILLPGPPREMEPMFLNEVRPLLESLQDASIRSITLRVFGIGESELETKVADLLENRNPTAALYAKTGEVHIRITARAQNTAQAEVMCREYAGMFRSVLGALVYSDDGADLETTVVRTLAKNGNTVAIAESCTGGLLGERLTSVPGSSAVFGFGAITYANDTKHQLLGVSNGTLRRFGAVSSQTAAEMAFGAKKRGHADFGVAITGIAGPGGGTPEKPVGLVYIAVAGGNQVYVRKMFVKDRSRDVVRALATQHALDMLRRVASAMPMPGAKLFSSMQAADYERTGSPRLRFAAVGRLLAALLLVLVVFGLVIFGIYLTRGGGATGAAGKLPSELGYSYGTEEYDRAANRVVEQEKRQNPSVTGLVAMPGAVVEDLVSVTNVPQPAIETQLGLPGIDSMAVVSAEARPGVPMQNPLLMAKEGFSALNRFLDTNRAGEIASFTYYNEHYSMEYHIFAIYVLDDFEAQPDGFDAEILDLSDYTDYMTYAVGAKARSLYDVPVAISAGDSYMTLATPDPSVSGRYIYMCGRLAHAEEADPAKEASPAGTPLYPAEYYKKTGAAAPDTAVLFENWMRWFLQGSVDNGELVFRAGMPQQDAAPATDDKAQLTVTMNGEVVTAPVAEILAQICQAEASYCEPEAVKAVAIAAHTWILSQYGAGVAAPEVIGLQPNAAVLEAATQVARQVISADGETPAFTPWFQLAANATNPSVDAFGFERKYLAGVPSLYDQSRGGWRVITSASTDALGNILAPRLGVDLADYPEKSAWITNVQRNSAGYVQELTVFGKTLSGIEFWHDYLERDGMPILPSPAFEVDFSNNSYVFTSYGQGHGCGLSIAGAQGEAIGGKSCQDILANFFPETSLIKWE